MAETNIIELRNVRFVHGDQAILKGLDLKVARGEVITLLGESGCGKTTTLKLINRLIDPTSGEVRVEGRSPLDWDPIELRRHIGYVLQDGGLFPHLTVRENVAITLKLLDQESLATNERSN